MSRQEMKCSGEVLIVDDIPANLKLLTDILNSIGYKVRPASSGEQALAAIARRQPEIILLDINMPGIDGFEVCRRLKNDKSTQDIPVIFISALNELSDRVKGFEVGGVDFISKPIQQEEVLVRVNSHLQLRRMQLNLEALVQERTLALRESNERLHQSEDKYRRIVESLRDEYFFYSRNETGHIVYLSPSVEKVLGYQADEFMRLFIAHLTSSPVNKPVHRYIKSRSRAGEEQPAYEIEVYRKDKSVCLLELKETPVYDKQGCVLGFEGIAHDITQRKNAEDKLAFMAEHDPLTQLPNRLLLSSRLEEAICHAEDSSSKIAVFFLDMDRFKDVNDTFGHPFGDVLLQSVADRLTQSVDQHTILARLGGDEFVILFHFQNIKEVERLANGILSLMEKPFNIEEHELYLGVSIGISLYPDDGHDVATLIRNSDSAMYQAKALGRNTFKFYSSELTQAAAERIALMSELRPALDKNEFQLFYQPKIELASGRIIGAEALIRWESPDGSFVPPDKFIPLAESSSLILVIGEWVLREACAQMAQWLNDNFDIKHLSVNVSGVQIQRGGLADLVSSILCENNLDALFLDLEITESVLMTDPEYVASVLRDLRALGTTLSIDDFGTGYSSLAYIKRFPINYLKIDRSFIRDIPDNADDKAIALAIIALGRSLQLDIIAEGVEDEAQQAFLINSGCQYAQGYLYSRPVPAAEFTALLTAQKSHTNK